MPVKQLADIATYNRNLNRLYTSNKSRLAILKLCIIGDLLLDIDEYSHIADIEIKYTEDLDLIAKFTDEECFAVFLQSTMGFLFTKEELSDTNFLQDSSAAIVDVLKYTTMQQKIDPTVLINYIWYLIMEYQMNTQYSIRSRNYIDRIAKSNHTYNLIGKSVNGLNRTIDKSLNTIIDLELKKYKLTL